MNLLGRFRQKKERRASRPRPRASSGSPDWKNEKKGDIIRLGTLGYDGTWPHPENLGEYEKWYQDDGEVASGINVIVALTVGIGFYTESENERAKEIIDEWCGKIDLDRRLQNFVRTYLVNGFCPVERWAKPGPPIGKLQLKLLPPDSVKVRVTRKGDLLGYKQDWFGQTINFLPREIIWFVHNPIGSNPYGMSQLCSILSLIKEKHKILVMLPKVVSHHASPLTVWKSKGSVRQVKKAVTEREKEDDVFIGNIDPNDVQFETVKFDPRSRFVEYIQEINNQILEGLQAPLLHYLRNATQASATKMLEVIDGMIQGVQRYVKRIVEKEMFEVVLRFHGITDKVTLNWGSKKTGIEKIDLTGLAALVSHGVLTPDQAADLLQKMGIPVEAAEPDDPYKKKKTHPVPPGAPVPAPKNGDQEKRFEYVFQVT